LGLLFFCEVSAERTSDSLNSDVDEFDEDEDATFLNFWTM